MPSVQSNEILMFKIQDDAYHLILGFIVTLYPNCTKACWGWMVSTEFVPMRPSLWRQPVCPMLSCLMGWSVKFLDGVPLKNVRPLSHIQPRFKSCHFYIQIVGFVLEASGVWMFVSLKQWFQTFWSKAHCPVW